MKQNGSNATDATRDLVVAMEEIVNANNELECLATLQPWWHKGSSVAALFLLANLVALMWYEMMVGTLPTAVFWIVLAMSLMIASAWSIK